MFHKRICKALRNIPGVIVYIDDILIWGRTQAEHDERLQQVLETLRNFELSINDSKCEISKTRVKFLGHVVEDGRLFPDPDKVLAIKNFPSPHDKKSLKRFLGMMSYLQKFVPHYTEMTDLFRPLLKEKHEWLWTEQHESMMNKIRTSVNWTQALRIFRPGKALHLYVDASSTGLGAVLIQDNEPIYFASRSLTPAEEKYPQIEKELLALVWAFERLDLYTYGSEITAYTDHKPLVGIKEKPLDYLSTRQQRFMGRLQRYHFQLKFIPGKNMVVPDCLSRAPLTGQDEASHEKRKFMGTELEAETVFVSELQYVALSDELRQKLHEECETDSEYQATREAYAKGWPEEMKEQCRQYWSDKTDIYEEQGLLFYHGRPVVPDGARERFLESIHRGHVGIQTGCRRAQRVWWPGINKDVKRFVQTCHTCQASADNQRREPMQSYEIPSAPGLVIGSDFFDCGNDQYVIFVDLFSTWIEFFKVGTKDAKSLKKALRVYISRNGVPRVFTSDQGAAFTSQEFQIFCDKFGIKRMDGSAKHERGNAHAEAAVKKIKKLLTRCKDEDELVKAILAWHQTEVAPGRPSPAQIHLGRNLRDDLNWNVEQAQVQWEDVRKWRTARNEKAKEYFDRGTRELSPMTEGQKVFVRVDEEWKEGVIEKKLERPRSYAVKMDEGRTVERNRVKLKPNETRHSKKPRKPVTFGNSFSLQQPRAADTEGNELPVLWPRAEEHLIDSAQPDDSPGGAARDERAVGPPPRDGSVDAEETARLAESEEAPGQMIEDSETGMDTGQRVQTAEGSSDATEGPRQPRMKKARKRLIEEC